MTSLRAVTRESAQQQREVTARLGELSERVAAVEHILCSVG
ncbi:hypothetical protein [Actinomadura xylanilytica]|nr:hypothetical protein [Actinomadura xylanilytica]MDL4776251.1 hypothetical protein [Actinomadura xylanilytica]